MRLFGKKDADSAQEESPELTAARKEGMEKILAKGKGKEGEVQKFEELKSRATELQDRLAKIPEEVMALSHDDEGQKTKSRLGQEMIASLSELQEIIAEKPIAAPQVHEQDIARWEGLIQKLKDQATENIVKKENL